jgi:hypothetical protein
VKTQNPNLRKEEARFRRELTGQADLLQHPTTPTQRAADIMAASNWINHNELQARQGLRMVHAEWSDHYTRFHGHRPPEHATPTESFQDTRAMHSARWIFLGTEMALGAATAIQTFNLPPAIAAGVGVAFTAITYTAASAIMALIQQDDARERETLAKVKNIAYSSFIAWGIGITFLIAVCRGASLLGDATQPVLATALTVLTLITPLLAASIGSAADRLAWANPYAHAYRVYANRLNDLQALRTQLPPSASAAKAAAA